MARRAGSARDNSSEAWTPGHAVRPGRRGAAWALSSFASLVWSTAWAGASPVTVGWRERIALPQVAGFAGEIQDTSGADVSGQVESRTPIEWEARPPSHLALGQDQADLQAGPRHAAQGTARPKELLPIATARARPVLDGNGAPLVPLLGSGGPKPETRPSTSNLGALPASFEGELPGAGNAIRWHIDLMPEGRFQLRITHLGRPEPNRFDDVGRWMSEPESGRVVLRGEREGPVFLLPVNGGAALRKLDLAGKTIESSHKDRLERLPQFSPIEPRLNLSGMFSYMADAASITLCADGQRLPVAMEGDFRELQAAYRKAGLPPGQALLASLEGRLALRPSLEEGQPPRTALVVERFLAVWPSETCGDAMSDAPLRGTYWKLVRLGGEAVTAAEKPREAHLVFAPDALRVAGSSGCNRVSGGFELDGDRLRLGPMAMTRMACPDGMDREQRFVDALEKARRYRVRGSHLEVLGEDGPALARFEAVAGK